MTLPLFYELQSEQGQRLLGELAAQSLTDDDLLPLLARYREEYPVELLRAAVDLTRLRRKAAVKFARAADMFFTRDTLEMASAEVVAAHTSQRFAGLDKVLDLCCGIGGDMLALAVKANHVIAVDQEALSLEMAHANARANALDEKIDCISADVISFMNSGLFAPVDAIFIDPSRRAGVAAARQPERYSPPLSWCLGLLQYTPRLAIKVSPAMDYHVALSGLAAEVEIISLHGECKEALLWLGEFRSTERRATVLPGAHTISSDGLEEDRIAPIGAWFYEPDAAVVRAHLIQHLAAQYRLWRIDEDIAYLSGDQYLTSPYMTGYQVLEIIPWSLKRLNVALTKRNIGRVTIKKRGFPLTPEALHPKLKLKGTQAAILLCTQAQGQHVVVIAERK